MKIAITADPFIPVPPLNYGGIERIIDFLVLGLRERGHEVLLVANKSSSIDGPVLRYDEQHKGVLDHFKNIRTISKLKQFQPDIIHSFSRLAYLAPFAYSGTAKLMSYQREPTIKQIINANRFFKRGTISFTGCSNYISRQIAPHAPAHTVYNGVDMANYRFVKDVAYDAPLMFLGRIELIKGVHIAIDIAKRTGKKLIIAGNIPVEKQEYFKQEIQPKLDGNITYVGEVNDVQKNAILGSAAALLMPIQWNEPFGIVMAEAMACGTPVIGFNRGALPEIVHSNINGFVAADIDEMASQVMKIGTIDRTRVYNYCKQHFSSDVIIENYISLYKKLISTR